jgi:Plasmid pRiA4b ORF-3-like protein
MTVPKTRASGPRRRGPVPVVPYQLKVSLIGIEPEIWRRVVVTSNIKLSKLNHVIQGVMGWTNSHLHQFTVGSTIYSDPEFEMETDHEDESRVKLVELAPHPPSAFIYEYDFGDSWSHVVVVEDYWMGDPREIDLPLCVGGARACPPEDVGGNPGYEEFLRVVLDPTDEEHEGTLTWVGGAFDPDAFDAEEVNARLRRLLPKGRVKAVGR